ncbi:MAG: hypothetical protein H6813_04910 [Phycisphaeraceae bacterium]|nr:hypothetical protein [Phycisphaeraceae bacterium]MCB9847724.1 hypothetical protein [Phycisphaeraceae bacterium]
MPLIEEMERSGAWMFRWRSYLPLVMLALCLVALVEMRAHREDNSLTIAWEALSFLVSGAGLGVRVLTIGHTPRRTSGRNTRHQVAEKINTTGMYSVVRNPLYLGNFIVGLGAAMFTRIWWVALIYALLFFLYYERIILAEESFLRSRFGERYTRWASRTPAFIPRLSGYVRPELPFCLKTVLRREYNGMFVVVLVFALLEFFDSLVLRPTPQISAVWASLLGGGFLLWASLRFLKKRTALLRVEGR